MSLNEQACKGKWHPVAIRSPQTVCCDEALMVCALRSVGVELHPGIPFRIYLVNVDGQPVTLWRWLLAPRSCDGKYDTLQLIRWWKDDAWRKANMTHEFAIVATALKNMGTQAAQMRGVIPRAVMRKGKVEAHIPANASPALRQFLLDKLEGKIPMHEKFQEVAA